MNMGRIQELLSHLNCHLIKPGFDKVRASCPFAPWGHRDGRDQHPSFVVWVNDDSESSWYCSGCKASGRSMLGLVWKYERHSGHNLKRLIEFVHKRHLTEETIRAWGLGDDLKRKRAQIPIRDVDGILWGITGRLYAENCWCGNPFSDNMFGVLGKCPECGRKKPPKYLHTKGMKKERLLFGEHMIDRSFDVVYVVEGHLDAIWLWQLGYRNVVAVMGSTLSQIQADKLVDWFSLAILVPDGDVAGREMIYGKERYQGAKRMLGDRINLLVRTLPDSFDPGGLSVEDAQTYIGAPTYVDTGLVSRYKNDLQ